MEPLYRGHIGTLETVLYIEVVLVIPLYKDLGNCPLYRGCPLGPWKL